MAYEPLHHKYRPQTFADLVGQDAIATTLTYAIQQNKIAPAYLFTGPRGTGKTSSARILAKSLNCLNSKVPTEKPCGQCAVCTDITQGKSLDVVEIDAASNTGVDHIRELIERAQFAPVQCRYKVYIIDECHMLSTAAFNSLLKTLEEPPDRVIFVLATTDPQRVLPTIISRCQSFPFRRIPIEAMVKHLRHIATQEHINITDTAVLSIAQTAQGGLRDAESLLDQVSLITGEVTVEKIWDLVGAVPEKDLMSLLLAIASDQPETVLQQTRYLLDRGREPLIVFHNLVSFYRDLLIAKTAPSRSDLVMLTPPTWEQLCQVALSWEMTTILASQKHLKNSETQIKNTTQPRLWLEVTLLELLPSALQIQHQRNSSARPNLIPQEPSIPQSSTHGVVKSQTTHQPTESPPVPTNNPEHSAAVKPERSLDNEQLWQQVISLIHQGSTQALLRQHGQLLDFRNGVASIGIRSQPLLLMVQKGLSSINAAFLEVCQGEIKVNLQVISTGTERQNISKNQVETNKDATIFSENSERENEPNNLQKKEPEPNLKGENLVIQTEPKALANGSKQSSVINNPSQIISEPTVNLFNEETERKEIAIASQKLANFFDGEVLTQTKELEWLYQVAADWCDHDRSAHSSNSKDIQTPPSELNIEPENEENESDWEDMPF